jgi:hypothetical protein
MLIGVSEATVKGGKVVEDSRHWCIELIRSEGIYECGLGHGEPRHACLQPLPFIYA